MSVYGSFIIAFDTRCCFWQSGSATESGKQNFDDKTDGLLLLAVKKATATSAKPHLCNPIHYALFLMGLENMSKGTSRHSILTFVHQRLAEMFKLTRFSLMTKFSSGADKPLTERRVRSVAPVKLQKETGCSLGVVGEVLRSCVQGVECTQSGCVEVVKGASMKALNFEALLAGNDLTPMQRLLCELMQQKGKTLCASHFAPVSTGDRQTVTIDSAKTPQSSVASSASTIGSSSRKTSTSRNIPVSPSLERCGILFLQRAQDAGYFS